MPTRTLQQLSKPIRVSTMMLMLAIAACLLLIVTGDDFEVNNEAGNALCTEAYAAAAKEVKANTRKANTAPWTVSRQVTAGWHRYADGTKQDLNQVDYFNNKPVRFQVTFTLEDCEPANVEAVKAYYSAKDPSKRVPTKQPKITKCALECAKNTDPSVQPLECTPAYYGKTPLTKFESTSSGLGVPEFHLTSDRHYFFYCDPFNRPAFRKERHE